MRNVIAALLVATGAAAVNARDEDAKRWLGQPVLITEYGIQIIGNNDKLIGKLDGTKVTVARVDKNRAWVRDQRGQEGWVPAEKLVPLSEAVEFFSRRIKSDPKNAVPIYLRAWAHYYRAEYQPASRDVTEALAIKPKEVAYLNLRAWCYEELKQFDKAIADYGEILRLDPKAMIGYHNRAFLYASNRDFAKALADYTDAIRLDPNYPDAFAMRADVHVSMKNPSKALDDYNEACRLDAKNVYAFRRRAWLLATANVQSLRDGKKALKSAERACDLTDWKRADCLDAYATAAAEAGKFDEAVKWATKAAELATTAAYRDAIKSRVELFRAKKPFRE